MWTYEQATGMLVHDGELVGVGYSGHGEGKNNADYENVPDVGPIPRGDYEIVEPRDTETHGPYVMPLAPTPSTETFGRDGFLIHGDSIEHPGQASLGCIILTREIRNRIWLSGDHVLAVT